MSSPGWVLLLLLLQLPGPWKDWLCPSPAGFSCDVQSLVQPVSGAATEPCGSAHGRAQLKGHTVCIAGFEVTEPVAGATNCNCTLQMYMWILLLYMLYTPCNTLLLLSSSLAERPHNMLLDSCKLVDAVTGPEGAPTCCCICQSRPLYQTRYAVEAFHQPAFGPSFSHPISE